LSGGNLFVVYRSVRSDDWRWRWFGAKGVVIAVSGQAYPSADDCVAAINRLSALAMSAEVRVQGK
jgi:uncharacterized protein YegP (UPF0339 family)